MDGQLGKNELMQRVFTGVKVQSGLKVGVNKGISSQLTQRYDMSFLKKADNFSKWYRENNPEWDGSEVAVQYGNSVYIAYEPELRNNFRGRRTHEKE